jgi:two-component system sensor histidine kinase KdpD
VKSRLARYLDRRTVEISLPDDLPPVPGDRFLIEQMLVQVVENAWKYSRPGARIVISASTQDCYVNVSIWNEGLRIPDDEKGRIFDKFYRGAGDRARIEGTGLGLAIARSIAEAHGGGVWLDDKPEGTGFRFLLPVGPGVNGHDRESHHPADR